MPGSEGAGERRDPRRILGKKEITLQFPSSELRTNGEIHSRIWQEKMKMSALLLEKARLEDFWVRYAVFHYFPPLSNPSLESWPPDTSSLQQRWSMCTQGACPRLWACLQANQLLHGDQIWRRKEGTRTRPFSKLTGSTQCGGAPASWAVCVRAC